MMLKSKKIIVGREEWCGFPGLGLPAVKARVDSGAKTSSLHAFNIEYFVKNRIKYVKFDIHPVQDNKDIVRACTAKVVDRREITSSSGHSEKRYVIKTPLTLGEHTWDIELTLANRDNMGYRMLLGRQAMRKRLVVDPDKSFCQRQLDELEAKKLYSSKKSTSPRLRIVLLASNPNLYSNKRIIEAGIERGHDMRFVDVKYCYMNINTSPQIHYRGGEILNDVDAVIPRLKPSVTFYGCAVTRQFQATGAFCLNEAMPIARSRDKLRSMQFLSSEGVEMPITGFASSPEDTKDLIKMVGGAPLVVKLLEGTQGRGVVLAETNKAAESVINAFKSLQANILVQEFVDEADGKDLRCYVVDDIVVGSIERRAAEGEFRANLHLGGTAHTVKTTKDEDEIAIKAAQVLGLKVAGVDIIRSKSGPKVLEVNSSAGLQGIEGATGIDIAGLMIECIEKNVLEAREISDGEVVNLA